MKTLNDLLKEMTTVGTPACGLTGCVLGLILAALLLWIGFWKTLFVVVLALLGLFAGGVKDKHGFIRTMVNKLFPPKD